jgi:hypothetical protein
VDELPTINESTRGLPAFSPIRRDDNDKILSLHISSIRIVFWVVGCGFYGPFFFPETHIMYTVGFLLSLSAGRFSIQ